MAAVKIFKVRPAAMFAKGSQQAGSGIRSASRPDPDQSGVRSALAGSPDASRTPPSGTGAIPSRVAAATTATATPPAAQVRTRPYRGVRVTTQEHKESRAASSRAPAASTTGTQAGSSIGPPPPSATKRTSSRAQAPSREVRAKPASSQAAARTGPAVPTQPVQPEDRGPPAQGMYDRPTSPVDLGIEAQVRRAMSRGQRYTPEQWREYLGGTCWRWSKANLHWYRSNTGWLWEGDNRRGEWRWYSGEAAAGYQ